MDNLPFPTWVDQKWLLKVAVVLSPLFAFLVADIIGWLLRRIPRERLGPTPQTAGWSILSKRESRES